MCIIGFLEGTTPDHRGRSLSMLWKQTDDDAENTHDYIQWIFPLDEVFEEKILLGKPVRTRMDLDDRWI